DRALAMNSAHVPAWRNLADLLSQIGKQREALTCYRRALALAPDDPTLLWNESNAHLVLRQFAEGWFNYEKRFAADKTLVRPDHGAGGTAAGRPSSSHRGIVEKQTSGVRA